MESSRDDKSFFPWLHQIKPEARVAFFSALFFGLICHGTALFNKLSLHDDIAYLFNAGATITSGRWMLHLLSWAEAQTFGTVNASLPLFNGLLSLLCIGIIGGLLVSLLDIRNKFLCALTGCLLVAFPFVTALFAYMFTSHYYMIGLLMMVLCAWLICRNNPWWLKILAILLGASSIGIYQAFLSFLISILLLYDIAFMIRKQSTISDFLKQLAAQAICTLGVLAVYFAANRFFLTKYGVELTTYHGIDQMGTLPVITYLSRCIKAYHEFFFPTRGGFQDMYPGTLHHINLIVIAAEALLAIRQVFIAGKDNRGKAILLAVLFALVPLACNFIYVMAEIVHGVMIYGNVMHFVLFVWLLDHLELPNVKFHQRIIQVSSLLLVVSCIMFARYDNQCYLKATLTQQQAISYWTTLVSQIRSQEGYQPEMALAFIGFDEASDPTFYQMEELDFIHLVSYDSSSNGFLYDACDDIMRRWCGFSPDWYWGESLESLPEVQAMPPYPAYGSIQIIDNVIIVKFH